MSVRREQVVAERLLRAIEAHQESTARPVGGSLTPRIAILLYESMLQSRLQDLEARRLKDKGLGFYTIGSSGHETNVVFGHLLRRNDPAFLHYRNSLRTRYHLLTCCASAINSASV